MFMTQEKLNQVLDSFFKLTDGFIDQEHFDFSMKIVLDNQRDLYEMVRDTHISPFEIAMVALRRYAKTACETEYTVVEGLTTSMLVRWSLNYHEDGLCGLLNNTVNYITNVRAEAQKEEGHTMKHMNTVEITNNTINLDTIGTDVVCEHCGCIVATPEAGEVEGFKIVDGKVYCECCCDELFVECEECGELIPVDEATEYQLNRWARRYSIARGTYEEIKNMAKRECDRYMAVNLQNEHTVEIRMFRGTLNTESFFATLQLIDTMVKRCIEIGNDVRKLQSMTWDEFVASDHAELNSYLKRRGLTEGSVEEPEPQEGSEPRQLSYEDFSVGDHVRAFAAPDCDASLIGHTGVVEEIEPDSSRLNICVRFDNDRRWWCEPRTLEIITEEPVQQPETQRSVNGFSVGDHVFVNLLQNAGAVVPQHLSHGTVIGFSEDDEMAAIAFDCPRVLNEEYRVCTHDCSGLSRSLDSRWVSFDYMTLD